MENSTFGRILGALGLLLAGAYLVAEGLSNLVLLPLVVAFAGLSGAQGQAQVQVIQNQIILQLAFGIICLASSLFVAFFKIETVARRAQFASAPVSIPQVSRTSGVTTEELISELKLRTSRN